MKKVCGSLKGTGDDQGTGPTQSAKGEALYTENLQLIYKNKHVRSVIQINNNKSYLFRYTALKTINEINIIYHVIIVLLVDRISLHEDTWFESIQFLYEEKQIMFKKKFTHFYTRGKKIFTGQYHHFSHVGPTSFYLW